MNSRLTFKAKLDHHLMNVRGLFKLRLFPCFLPSWILQDMLDGNTVNGITFWFCDSSKMIKISSRHTRRNHFLFFLENMMTCYAKDATVYWCMCECWDAALLTYPWTFGNLGYYALLANYLLQFPGLSTISTGWAPVGLTYVFAKGVSDQVRDPPTPRNSLQ